MSDQPAWIRESLHEATPRWIEGEQFVIRSCLQEVLEGPEYIQVRYGQWVATCDAHVVKHREHAKTYQAHQYTEARTDVFGQSVTPGSREDAVDDVAEQIRLDIVDPPEQFNEANCIDRDDYIDAEIAKMIAERPDLVNEWRTVDWFGRKVQMWCTATEGHYTAHFYQHHGKGRHRNGRASFGHSDKSMDDAIDDLVRRETRDRRRNRPTGIDAMPADAWTDYDVAQAMATWNENLRPFYDIRVEDWRACDSPDAALFCVVRRTPDGVNEAFSPTTNLKHAMEVFEFMAGDIHGGAHLQFDGDCFDPPPWDCTFGGWHGMADGFGETAQLAISRCFLHKIANEKTELARRDALRAEATSLGLKGEQISLFIQGVPYETAVKSSVDMELY